MQTRSQVMARLERAVLGGVDGVVAITAGTVTGASRSRKSRIGVVVVTHGLVLDSLCRAAHGLGHVDASFSCSRERLRPNSWCSRWPVAGSASRSEWCGR